MSVQKSVDRFPAGHPAFGEALAAGIARCGRELSPLEEYAVDFGCNDVWDACGDLGFDLDQGARLVEEMASRYAGDPMWCLVNAACLLEDGMFESAQGEQTTEGLIGRSVSEALRSLKPYLVQRHKGSSEYFREIVESIAQ